MSLDDSHLHIHFAARYCRRTTIIGHPDDTQRRYFQDSAYEHVEVDEGRYRALVDHHTTDVHGHWFVGRRPLFSSRIRIPLPPDASTPTAFCDSVGEWWLELVHEPPPTLLEVLHRTISEAERKSDYAHVLVGELLACRLAVDHHRRKFVTLALEKAGVTVPESRWGCVVLENMVETVHGLLRTGELPIIA